MLNSIYQLTTPKRISVRHEDVDVENQVIIRPEYMALCHADQRYYQGKRDIKVLRKKLPMALIHESCGRVLYDPTGTFKTGESVIMIPNIPGDRNEKVIYENYGRGGGFLSSGFDGFMREFVNLPADRVVPFSDIDPRIAAITEFISVGMHAANRFEKASHEYKNSIGIWGDGSLSFVVSSILRERYPKAKITVIGRNINKLEQFSFIDETLLTDSIPDDFHIDHAFECCGGEGSYFAIDDIINHINPQGTVMLMGVSENKVAINTRDVLEKGLTLVGSSRSGRIDFENAVEFLKDKAVQRRFRSIIYIADKVKDISDIHNVFSVDMDTDFKTVFKWDV